MMFMGNKEGLSVTIKPQLKHLKAWCYMLCYPSSRAWHRAAHSASPLDLRRLKPQKCDTAGCSGDVVGINRT